jgi:hypothetical protein
MEVDLNSFFGNVPDLEQAADAAAERQAEYEKNGGGAKGGDGFQRFVGIMSVKNPVEVVRFLHDQPVVAYMHEAYDPGGKPPYRNAICFRNNCDFCAAGDEPVWKCAWLVLHKNHSFSGKDKSKKIIQPSIKVLLKGENFAGPFKERQKQLANYKHNFESFDFEMKQFGEGFGTKYSFTEIMGTEALVLPEQLPRMFEESKGKTLEEDRAEAKRVFSNPEFAKIYLQNFLVKMADVSERPRLIALATAAAAAETGRPAH